jgi:hypothetical protein
MKLASIILCVFLLACRSKPKTIGGDKLQKEDNTLYSMNVRVTFSDGSIDSAHVQALDSIVYLENGNLRVNSDRSHDPIVFCFVRKFEVIP